MSMLSAQCDELREVAYKVDEYQMGRERVPLKTAAIMREAADTIWQLRDDLQRANAENARLRSELEAVGIAAYLYGRDDLAAENAGLRELVRDLWMQLLNAYDRKEVDEFADRMRELGVEVDE